MFKKSGGSLKIPFIADAKGDKFSSKLSEKVNVQGYMHIRSKFTHLQYIRTIKKK